MLSGFDSTTDWTTDSTDEPYWISRTVVFRLPAWLRLWLYRIGPVVKSRACSPPQYPPQYPLTQFSHLAAVLRGYLTSSRAPKRPAVPSENIREHQRTSETTSFSIRVSTGRQWLYDCKAIKL